jgi:hypothetical protein
VWRRVETGAENIDNPLPDVCALGPAQHVIASLHNLGRAIQVITALRAAASDHVRDILCLFPALG